MVEAVVTIGSSVVLISATALTRPSSAIWSFFIQVHYLPIFPQGPGKCDDRP